MLLLGKKAVLEKRPIAIFPQGTRVNPKDKSPYLSGVSALYKYLKIPVVPVSLNSGLYWPNKSFKQNPGKIIIEFLEPIEPGLELKFFSKTLEDTIEKASDKLVDEA